MEGHQNLDPYYNFIDSARVEGFCSGFIGQYSPHLSPNFPREKTADKYENPWKIG